ncbi:MAG: hypothetical protein A3F84_02250 [Candidatus Handelsmanbacteria bacterium RIFCSPLOWO2_12_FULL_64_10]|uniref:AMMECR1 domain-containing protein n=1 Tax=Handelsmanbacteria sp. (strain RIFCSPLOWO2_12_FULL_64_10) TaxID=1817868 RepID=A0A1F6CLK5_HANXR|nr:MAG: hypothetical protein A3F84_02250 [Candidatus Handelsmanbacteria bacterium RIFCSPLOWO2_12_FULL_64_10]
MLGAADRAALLRLARESIAARLCGAPPPASAIPEGPLTQPAGAFVTLRLRGELRGCVGQMAARGPLWRTIAEVAVKSAVEDDRFDPVSAHEVGDLRIDISVLSPPRRCAPADVVPGVHGVEIRSGAKRGVLLPQVSVEWKWNRDQLLDAVCHKAGLPAGAWKDAELSVFTAEVFGEA